MEWARYFELEVNAFHREDYYLAQIAAEIRRGHVKHPKRVKVEDLVLRFKTGAEPKSQAPSPGESKRFWLNVVGKKA